MTLRWMTMVVAVLATAAIIALSGWTLTANAGQLPRLVELCDSVAAHPDDPQRRTTGIPLENVRASMAQPACLAAINARPDDGLSYYQYGRALERAGLLRDAVEQYHNAIAYGHNFAAFNLSILFYNHKIDSDLKSRSVNDIVNTLKKNPTLLCRVGDAALYGNAVADARAFFEKGMALKDPECLAHLGRLEFNGEAGFQKNEARGQQKIMMALRARSKAAAGYASDILSMNMRDISNAIGGRGGSGEFNSDAYTQDQLERNADRNQRRAYD